MKTNNKILIGFGISILILLLVAIKVDARMELHCEEPCGGSGSIPIQIVEETTVVVNYGSSSSLDLPRHRFAYIPFQFRCNGTLYTFEYTPIYAKVSGLSPKLHLFSDNTFDLQECKIEYTYKNRYIWLNEAR